MMYHQKLLNMADTWIHGCLRVTKDIPILPRNPVILLEDDRGVQSPPKRKVFGFHYHSQKVIGSLGSCKLEVV